MLTATQLCFLYLSSHKNMVLKIRHETRFAFPMREPEYERRIHEEEEGRTWWFYVKIILVTSWRLVWVRQTTRGMETLGRNCVGTLMELSHFKALFPRSLLHSSVKILLVSTVFKFQQVMKLNFLATLHNKVCSSFVHSTQFTPSSVLAPIKSESRSYDFGNEMYRRASLGRKQHQASIWILMFVRLPREINFNLHDKLDIIRSRRPRLPLWRRNLKVFSFYFIRF